MPSEPAKPLTLLFGEDDFAVKDRARSLYTQSCQDLGGMDHELIDAQVGNAAEVLKTLGRLREALNTLPFFGGGKVIWWQDVNFLGDDRTSISGTVTEALAELAADLAKFEWRGVRLIISAGKIDKRRIFYKTLEKIGNVQQFASWSEDKDWGHRAESLIRQGLKERGKSIDDEAVSAMLEAVGPNPRQLVSEVEKVSLYVGSRGGVTRLDVNSVVSRNKQSKAFAMAEALAERNLGRALRCLDEEIWEMQFDKKKSEFGLLAGLTAKVRSMIVVAELLRLKWLKPTSDARSIPSQLQRIPPERLPEEKRYNPAAMHPFVLSKTLQHCQNYTLDELVRAMELLLKCNQRLMFSDFEGRLVLQQTLVDIIGGAPGAGPRRRTA